ncbi:MAG: hypothetical protein ABI551_23070 [Polyangiaceae bacterium]
MRPSLALSVLSLALSTSLLTGCFGGVTTGGNGRYYGGGGITLFVIIIVLALIFGRRKR